MPLKILPLHPIPAPLRTLRRSHDEIDPGEHGHPDLRLQFVQEVREIEIKPNIDLKIEDYNSLSDDDDSSDTLAVQDIPGVAQTEKDSIFKPKPKIGCSITGNVKDTNLEELIRFLKEISSNDTQFIITKEKGINADNPHLHFYVQETTLQLETVKKKLRCDPYFKKLKGTTAGGDHKYNIKYIVEKIQFYYIFKEVCLQNISDFMYSEGFCISPTLVEQYQCLYKKEQEHKKLCASNKFYYWVSNRHSKGSNVFIDKRKLVKEYLTFSRETNRATITYFDCEKMVNYIILRTDEKQLEDEFVARMCKDRQY